MAWLDLTAVGAALLCFLWAGALLLRRVPVRGQLLFDGYRAFMRERDAAIILSERAPVPLTMVDRIGFTTREGREMRVDLRRRAAPRSSTFLVWYDPARPERVTATGPLTWFARGAAILATLVWYHWLG